MLKSVTCSQEVLDILIKKKVETVFDILIKKKVFDILIKKKFSEMI